MIRTLLALVLGGITLDAAAQPVKYPVRPVRVRWRRHVASGIRRLKSCLIA